MKEMTQLCDEPIEEVGNMWIGNVMVCRIGFKNVEITLLTLKQFLEQKSIYVTPLIIEHFKRK